ncbi:MAG: PTS glucose transporter subunit IIA [bacterium]|nr:PTS glucose transporter subunit IIA [bacterium]
MGLFDKIFAKKETKGKKTGTENSSACEPLTVYAPLSGKAMPLGDIPDPVFSQGILGPGCGIEPSEGAVYAPFHGEISFVADTKHAVGISSPDGMELMIHVGLDTVDMGGKGFDVKVKQGQKVHKGELLLTFSFDDIRAAGHPSTTAVLLTNGSDYAEVKLEVTGNVETGAVLLRAAK